MLDQEALDEIIRRIVEVARPEKIILFGSITRGVQERRTRRLRSTEGSAVLMPLIAVYLQ